MREEYNKFMFIDAIGKHELSSRWRNSLCQFRRKILYLLWNVSSIRTLLFTFSPTKKVSFSLDV